MSQARAERPELVARFRGAGLTQKSTAETLGVTEQTVYNTERKERDPKYLGRAADPEPDVVDAELVEWFCEDCGGDEGDLAHSTLARETTNASLEWLRSHPAGEPTWRYARRPS